jgi:hypothetical protein
VYTGVALVSAGRNGGGGCGIRPESPRLQSAADAAPTVADIAEAEAGETDCTKLSTASR